VLPAVLCCRRRWTSLSSRRRFCIY
jgi:hypothetical protein